MSPRASKNAKSPDTIDSRLRTVAADTPGPPPAPPPARQTLWVPDDLTLYATW